MAKKPFQFKQFQVQQDRCAMKIGTDGVLLGAWTDISGDPDNILDVGTGTGIIALMLAQRCSAPLIDALEIDEQAYEQAVENFENSPWGDRLFCYHAEYGEFVEEMQDEEKYDLIIANPPFYGPQYKTTSKERDMARFQDALPFELLLEGSSFLLNTSGHLDVIIPKDQEIIFLQTAEQFGLFANRTTYVRGNSEAPVKRCLISLGFSKTIHHPEMLTIETARHQYTDQYQDLVKDFYLNM